MAYQVATAADDTALTAWLEANTQADVVSVVYDGSQFVVVYKEIHVMTPTKVMQDRVNTR